MNLSRRERGQPRTAGVWRKQAGGSIDGQQQAADDKGESNEIAAEEEECALVAGIKAYPRAAARVASFLGGFRSQRGSEVVDDNGWSRRVRGWSIAPDEPRHERGKR